MKFETKRQKAKYCPCGKSNKDGKFTPFEDYEDKGYCHSCGKTFYPEKDKRSYKVTVENIQDYSVKAYLITNNNETLFVPKTAIEQKEDKELFIYDWFYNQNKAFFLQVPFAETSETSTLSISFFRIKEDWILATCERANSNLHSYLINTLGEKKATEILNKYKVGTCTHKDWRNATIFYTFDITGQPVRGKIIMYDNITGKRKANAQGLAATSVHYLLSESDNKPPACFFGEHLLNEYPNKTIAIVESEKTALIATAYLPKLIWLASDGSSGLNAEKCKVLKNRQVVLFPDKGKFEQWTQKVHELDLNAKVSDLLESSNVPDNADIADFLTLQRPNAFDGETVMLKDGTYIDLTPEGYPMEWDLPLKKNDALSKHWRRVNIEAQLEAYTKSGQINEYNILLNEATLKGLFN